MSNCGRIQTNEMINIIESLDALGEAGSYPRKSASGIAMTIAYEHSSPELSLA